MKLEVLESRDRYMALCEVEPSIPLFSQAWWLDAVAGPENWSAVLVMRGDEVAGALPYVIRRRWGMTLLTQPQLTQALGPWLRPTQAKYAKALAIEKDVLGALGDGLPRFDGYRQNWNCACGNWLPFYWRGYQQTTQYTYRLNIQCGTEFIWSGLQNNIRSDIRKALDRYQITVRPARDLDEFLQLNRQTFQRQGRTPPYSNILVQRLYEAACDRSATDVLIAEDPEGNQHAGAFIVRDARTAYYLMGGGDPAYRTSGAGSLCLWEAICRQPEHIETFDFEGSMLEPVERFFRAFGAIQVPYFRVERIDSRLLRAALCARNVLRKRH